MNRRTLAVIVLALAALLVLAGCDGAGQLAQAPQGSTPEGGAPAAVPAATARPPATQPLAPQPTANAAQATPAIRTPVAQGTAVPTKSEATADDLDKVLGDLEESLKGVNTLDGQLGQ